MNAHAVSSRQAVIEFVVSAGNRSMVIGAAALALTMPVFAQNAEMQQKLAAVKQSLVQNKQKLQKYQWYETTQLNLKGDDKPATQNLCQYTPDGTVLKTPIGPPPPPPSGGRLKQKVIANKKAEMQDYMGDVKGLLSLYVPPNPQKMELAYQAGHFFLNPVGGRMNLVFTDYAQPGDKMSITFDPASKKITAMNVSTYMGEAKDIVTLDVLMSSLPDGTNFVLKTVLNATAKKLVVTTTNSNYQKVGGI
jgi:hypothetical protein